VTNAHPLSEKKRNQVSEKVFENIFCFGDVCLTSINEVKSIVSIILYIEIVAQNILCSLQK